MVLLLRRQALFQAYFLCIFNDFYTITVVNNSRTEEAPGRTVRRVFRISPAQKRRAEAVRVFGQGPARSVPWAER